jgi:dTDP-4-amino-4,6-dideoxygalactose transaminase
VSAYVWVSVIADVVNVRKSPKPRACCWLEDCAPCNGGSVGGQKVGTFGDMGIFSFQMNKNISSGEGSCVVTNDVQLYRRAFACHDLGYARDENGRPMLNDPTWPMIRPKSLLLRNEPLEDEANP